MTTLTVFVELTSVLGLLVGITSKKGYSNKIRKQLEPRGKDTKLDINNY